MTTKKFSELQEELGAYCKTGELRNDIPLSRNEALPHYRRLITNIVSGIIDNGFPISRKYLGKEWDELVSTFFKEHKCQTPQVWKLPKEFMEYVLESEYDKEKNLPFLKDLLYFEWLELYLFTMPDREVDMDYHKDGDPLTQKIVLNPEFEVLQVEFPIHLMAIEEAKKQKGQYFLILFRHHTTGNVHFLSLSPLHVSFLQKIEEKQTLKTKIVSELSAEFGIAEKEKIESHLIEFSNQLLKEGLILGYLDR